MVASGDDGKPQARHVVEASMSTSVDWTFPVYVVQISLVTLSAIACVARVGSRQTPKGESQPSNGRLVLPIDLHLGEGDSTGMSIE